MKPTITIVQANQKVTDYLTQVRVAFPAEARYKLTASEEHGPCLDPTDGGSGERVIATRTFQIFDLPKENIPSYFTAVKEWAQSHNFRILDNNPPNEYLWLENNSDSVRMALKANSLGGLYLIATSPCVWPDGTPAPEAAAPEAPKPEILAQPEPPVQKPRRTRPPVDDEDFAQTDWTDEDTY
ncbi:hypothetical protein ACFQ05_15285 [Amycolatopsis umgeniensis]|uniref:Uncharacterized protein n=1 Tax=Amycolatopsis umgeniensis TaxID=336628 RepID=A0A841B6X7_9PSEU|nr:hypothetical protein [Amycolatopsis umgeniensis]MBB5854671.1 hypothetical protein [Amycolatopsis umgeniensis]